jgi:hypothetical protein
VLPQRPNQLSAGAPCGTRNADATFSPTTFFDGCQRHETNRSSQRGFRPQRASANEKAARTPLQMVCPV